jgi:hypothetical protein
LEAIRSRVLQSFDSLKPQEVLRCADEPTAFCSSSNADQEACLVRVTPGALAGYRTGDSQSGGAPPLVLELLRDAGELQNPEQVFRRKIPGPHGEPGYESIFANSERTLAVLHVAEVRCIDISEIT